MLPAKNERIRVGGLKKFTPCQNIARLLLASIISRALADFFSSDARAADDARWYFCGEHGCYHEHLKMLGLPVNWLPEAIEPFAIDIEPFDWDIEPIDFDFEPFDFDFGGDIWNEKSTGLKASCSR